MEYYTRILAHSLSVLAVVIMGYWMGNGLTAYVVKDGLVSAKDTSGFSWSHGDARVFNWHPFLMSFGFVFCAMQAALVYISLPYSHEVNKRIHLSLHALGFMSAILGATAVFRFHNEHNITNLYSLHSWLGLMVLILFASAWLSSFVVFFYPGAKKNIRIAFAPYHIGLGLAIIGLVIATVMSGIMEKLSFNGSCNVSGELNGETFKGYMAPDCVTGNLIGLLVGLAWTAVIVTIWHAEHSKQRKPLKEEATPLLRGTSGSE